MIDANFWRQKPVIGMLHVPALPGAPRAEASMEAILKQVLADVEAWKAGGCHALMLENFGDVPFYPGRVPAHVVAALTRVATEVRRIFAGPLGINVLRNDGVSALGIAAAVGAQMVRVNVLCGARLTDQGLIQGIAHELLRERRALNAEQIAILADVDVKHSAPLAARPIADEVQDMLKRGLADGVIVSGSGTGARVDLKQLAAVKDAAGSYPVLIGSGASAADLADLAKHADGFIVGTSVKQGGQPTAAVDASKVKALMASHQSLPR